MAIKDQASRGVSRQVLADHVYEVLLIALMDGRLEAGTPVSIDEMARALDVSPRPVREALARLEATAMVRRTALRGYRVAALSAGRAGRPDERAPGDRTGHHLHGCIHADGNLTGELARAIDGLKAAPRGPSFSEFRAYWEADERSHRHADNQFLLSAYNALGGQVQRFRFFGGLGVTDADFAIAEHTEILRAFEAELARQA
jgi:DNA-binding GntR family transcriptional regulator